MDLQQGITTPCQSNLAGVPAQLFLTLINSLMASQCPLGSQEQYPNDYGPQLVDKEEFDFIIVGGGSSGSVVANKLSENPDWRILVLEAGGYPSVTSEIPALLFHLQESEEDWQYKTETSEKACRAYKNGRCRWPRGKVLGGCSTINAMLYNRGSSRDYDRWEVEGNSGWGYEDMKKHFVKIENAQSLQDTKHYGKGGYQGLSQYNNAEPITTSISTGAFQLGYPTFVDQDPEEPLGYYQSLLTIDKGQRMNAAKAFLGQVKVRENLRVATKTLANRILIDPTTLKAQGVEIQIGDKVLNVFAKKEVVLSAGALNTPQLLMLSGVGPKVDLEKVGVGVIKDLQGVGQNLQDHVIVPMFFKLGEDAFKKRTPGFLLDELYKYFVYRMGSMATIHITNLIGFINTKSDSKFPDIQFHHVGHLKNDKSLLPFIYGRFGFKDDLLQQLITINQDSNLLTVIPVLLNPKSRGKIELRSKDISESPKFHSGYFNDTNGDDMATMLKGMRFVQKLFKSKHLEKHGPEPVKMTLPACDLFEYDTDEYLRCYVQHLATTIYHQVGTAKMGPASDGMTVVDDRLRVHGVENLRVIDASIMPTIVSGNPNAACLAIGHKGGTLILDDWTSGSEHDEL